MMSFIPDDVVEKLKSDRMWALLLYVGLLVANAKFNLGVTEDQMTEVLYAVIAFIVGKSVRGTTAGSLVKALGPVLSTSAEAVVDGDDPPTGGKGKRKKPEA